MAVMYPTELPEYVLNDPYRAAEIDVYGRLKADLPDEYVCYYSRPWLGLTPAGEEKEGEADFVVAHPDKGFLVIEVKGGVVSRREGSEQWVSENRLKIVNKIKDPVMQASSSKHVLLRKLKAFPGWQQKFVTARHGVILPDSSRPQRDLGPNMPLWLFLFAEELKEIKAWVEMRFGRAKDEEDRPGSGLRNDGMQSLHQLLAGRIELRPSLARALREDRRMIDKLSADQIDVLDALDANPRLAIGGGAGTGKSLLALEKATRLGEAGFRTLLTCFNAPIGEHLKRMTAHVPSIVAGNFHAICDSLRKAVNITVAGGGSRAFFDALPAAMLDAVSKDANLKFDAIVVDEGQDFEDGWFETLKGCLKDPATGLFYIFYDDNQRIYKRVGQWLNAFPGHPYYLTKNFRNTRAINSAALRWYSGRMTRAIGPQGAAVEWVTVQRPGDVVNEVWRRISELIKVHGLEPSDIAVLSGGAVDGHSIVRSGQIAGHPACRAGTATAGAIVFDTVRRFKGLDRQAIILVDPDRVDEPELAYVALTRPRVYLSVIGGAISLRKLQEGIS